MSTTVSPTSGSNFPSAFTSIHSKLLLVERETTTITSFVSLPVIVNEEPNCPVTTQEPAGMGEDETIGLGTVVAPAGALPFINAKRSLKCPVPLQLIGVDRYWLIFYCKDFSIRVVSNKRSQCSRETEALSKQVNIIVLISQ